MNTPSTTPRTAALIAAIREDHKKGNFDDLQHYMGMCGDLAGWSRTLERELLAKQQECDRLREALVECSRRLKCRANYSGGWWGDPFVYEICNEVNGMVHRALTNK